MKQYFPLRFKKELNIYKILFLVILAIFSILSLFYSFSTPAFEGPDEHAHFKFSLSLYDGKLPEGRYEFSTARSPLYYIINGALLHFLDPAEQREGFLLPKNYDYPRDPARFHHSNEEFFTNSHVGNNHTLRLLPTFFGLITLVFVYQIGKIIFSDNKLLPIFLTALVSLVPTFVWMNSVMNTDSLVWMFSTITIFFILKFVNEPKRIKYVVLIAVFASLAVSSKANALVLYPIIIIGFGYVFFSKSIKIKSFLKQISTFVLFSFISMIWQIPFRILIPGVSKETNNFDTVNYTIQNLPIILPTLDVLAGNKDLVLDRIFNYGFIHTRLVEFSLGGMGWNVLWPPQIFFSIADYLLIFSFIGLLLYLIKRKSIIDINLKRGHFVIIISSIIIMLGVVFYNWTFTQVGIARYTFPTIVSFGILLSLGWYVLVNKKRFLKPLLLIPLIFLFILNIQMLVIINDAFAFKSGDHDGDGIIDQLDTNLTDYSNSFKKQGILSDTTGTILNRVKPPPPIDIEKEGIELKEYVYGIIHIRSPNYDQIKEKIPSSLIDIDNIDARLKSILHELESEGKIVSKTGWWTIPIQKLSVINHEVGIMIRNNPSDISQTIEVSVCNNSTMISIPPESYVIFSCNQTGLEKFDKVDYSSLLPPNISDGDIIQSKDRPEIYFIQNGFKRHIANPSIFKNLGFTESMIKLVPDNVLSEIPTGTTISSLDDYLN